jgi:hypothetical protein
MRVTFIGGKWRRWGSALAGIDRTRLAGAHASAGGDDNMTESSDLSALLEKHGFLHARSVLDAVTIDTLLVRSLATLFRGSAAREATKSNGSLCNLHDSPEFADLIASPAILDLLREAGATDPRWMSGFLISKPGGGPPLFWHQDWWYWDDDESYQPRAHQLFVMVYLTDTSRENGCLRVIPGSHLHEHPLHHLEHYERLKTLQSYQNPDDPAYADQPDEVPVAVRAGDVLVGDARLLHGAYANRTNAERPLLTMWYMPHWSSMPPAMRASVYQEFFMRGIESRMKAERPLTPFEWPEALRNRVMNVLPPDDGGVPPMRQKRTPDFARLSMPQ